MKLIIKLLTNGLAVMIAAYLLPGVHVQSFFVAIVAGVVLGVVNMIVRPILTILTLPLSILTLGLFTFVINGLCVLIASNFVPGFAISSFGWALLFSIVLSLINWFLNTLSQ